MTVKTLIELLSKFPQEYRVTITDSYECAVYTLDKAEILPYKEEDGSMSIDIGVEECRVYGVGENRVKGIKYDN
jgi:hypothetical protein